MARTQTIETEKIDPSTLSDMVFRQMLESAIQGARTKQTARSLAGRVFYPKPVIRTGLNGNSLRVVAKRTPDSREVSFEVSLSNPW